ncbi:tetratricopeptide repeat-containing glycosyltransferase family 2 protein [Petrotoga halophila]|uniref:Glycosyltransferase n=1 Tax=Petrotoga halophila DSM 16923 TaxID=1122953 RepID=A0A2S5EBX8_9BACT|nr:glycosyltransferase [Petrotoga halophila]POZ90656.1 glycosyltransferase [Petrotoga halophila DSM 16923]
MSANNEKLLSVAMIVKDEEANIRRALEAIKDVADEIIVVDTGSMDRTPQIVKEYTDKLYFHEWQNDFSEARNYSLKFPTCEWVMRYDADEEVSESFIKNIREFLKKLPKDVNTVYLPIISYMDMDHTKTEVASIPIIFRKGTVEYQNVVHNQAIYKPKVVHANFPIYHYGYIWTRNLRKKKHERTATLIREQLKSSNKPLDRIYYLIQLYKIEEIGRYSFRRNELAWKIIKEIKEIKKVNNLPTITLEFLYLFGVECIENDMKKLGEELLRNAIKLSPKYPDPYFGMMLLCEKEKKYDELLDWSNKFFQVLDTAMNEVETYCWTIMSLKRISTAYLLAAKAFLMKKDFNNFNKYVSKAFSEKGNFALNKSNIQILMKNLVDVVESKEEMEQVLPGIKVIFEVSENEGIQMYFDELIQKLGEFNLKVEKSLLEKFKWKNEISKYVIKKFETSEDQLLNFVTKNDYLKFVNETGIYGLLFLFYVLEETKSYVEILKELGRLRKVESEEVRGVLYVLIGDAYLKLEKYKEAIEYYKKAKDIYPEVSRFIKPLLEDLSMKLSTEFDIAFDEMYSFYTSENEFIFDIVEYLGEDAVEKLYLISDISFANYASASLLIEKDPQKAETLLKKVENIDEFPFYYYRLAKIYEKKDIEKALDLHIKAVEENNKLADISFGIYSYSGLYPNTQISLMKNNDEMIWVGNISEKFSTLGIIHPIRSWKKSDTFMYASPYPSDEALRIYEEREKETYKSIPLEIKKEVILRGLIDSGFKDVKVLGVDKEKYEGVFEDLGISVKDNSNNLLIVGEFEKSYDVTDILKKAKKVLAFVYVPDLKDRENVVWFIPKFRVLRTTGELISLFEKEGFKVSKVEAIDGNLRFIEAYKE